MKKLFLIFMLLISTPSFAAIQWRNGTAEQTLEGTSAANLIGYNSFNKVVQPLDNLLSTYCTEYLQYNSTSTITAKAGSCVVSNAGGTIRMFMLDASDTVLSATNLDSGSSFSSGTTYYVYATSPNSTTQVSTYYISTSSTAPSGQTYYRRLGNFTTDSSAYITKINNDNDFYAQKLGDYASKSIGATYQASSDGFVLAYATGQGAGGNDIAGYTDSSASPTTLIVKNLNQAVTGAYVSITMPVKKGNYWKVTTAGPGGSTSVYWIPLSN